MTEAQVQRAALLAPDELWRIPLGSWLAVRRNETGTWIEVVDPEASSRLAFDFGPGQ